jgi:hypothetical protein
MMRRFLTVFALLIFAGSNVAFAAPKKTPSRQGRQVCHERCDQEYQVCRNHAATKQARHTCKVSHKTCKRSCG